MHEIILHHYPQSPYSEKVRLTFGLKGLSWRAVEQPSIMPKPELLPLTGAYRKIPVMQIGADVYCDSQCIVRELERRHPTPTVHPGRVTSANPSSNSAGAGRQHSSCLSRAHAPPPLM